MRDFIVGRPAAALFPEAVVYSMQTGSVGGEATITLRTGYTTGTSAAAAAKAAAMALWGFPEPQCVEVTLPGGDRVTLPVAFTDRSPDRAVAGVKKDGGDDPDVTHGSLVMALVKRTIGVDVVSLGGEGIGIVTRPGLSVPIGEPAINPTPRRMIREAVREVTDEGLEVTISIPGGEELANKTFNPRLGIRGGLSVLGTSGIVRPFSCSALRDSVKCALNVAKACEVKTPVMVPGRIGERAAHRHFQVLDEQLIEVGNEWGFALDESRDCGFRRIMVLGHPGKLAKLAGGRWDTHSSRSESALPMVKAAAAEVSVLSADAGETVEGLFAALAPPESALLGATVSARIADAVADRICGRQEIAVVLVNMEGSILGSHGDLTPWLVK
ncbi:MAG: cobalt-precorrin-5B (C(1))-methyltransferase CbiD [Pseudomonadota bacterium]